MNYSPLPPLRVPKEYRIPSTEESLAKIAACFEIIALSLKALAFGKSNNDDED
jgi:hypothetical protein